MLNIFNCTESDQYLVYPDGTLWIHGHLLCEALGHKDPQQAIIRHTSPEDREKPSELSNMLNIPWFVNEVGVWKLAVKSKTPEAVAFRQKLCSEILPAIRKNGVYISDTATLDQMTTLLNQAQTRLDQMTEELTLSNLKVSQMSDYIQGESDRTKKAKESVTEDAIKEAVVDYVCVTEDTNGDALVFQTYAKPELAKVRLELERSNTERRNSNRMLQSIYGKVSQGKTDLAKTLKNILDGSDQKYLNPS